MNQVEKIAPDVYFHEGDLKAHGHCNNGWIIFEDYVLVIDGNFPSGAKEIIPKIKALTDKPIRFAFDTHHHGDHAYGNQVWVENGATPVAHVGVIEEMKKYETGHYGDKPGRWEDAAKTRPDVAASKLKPPTLLYRTEMIFDDGKHRVELLHFGVAHTHGDGWAWLPKEKILFTGDACVNGPYNYTGGRQHRPMDQDPRSREKAGRENRLSRSRTRGRPGAPRRSAGVFRRLDGGGEEIRRQGTRRGRGRRARHHGGAAQAGAHRPLRRNLSGGTGRESVRGDGRKAIPQKDGGGG